MPRGRSVARRVGSRTRAASTTATPTRPPRPAGAAPAAGVADRSDAAQSSRRLTGEREAANLRDGRSSRRSRDSRVVTRVLIRPPGARVGLRLAPRRRRWSTPPTPSRRRTPPRRPRLRRPGTSSPCRPARGLEEHVAVALQRRHAVSEPLAVRRQRPTRPWRGRTGCLPGRSGALPRSARQRREHAPPPRARQRRRECGARLGPRPKKTDRFLVGPPRRRRWSVHSGSGRRVLRCRVARCPSVPGRPRIRGTEHRSDLEPSA